MRTRIRTTTDRGSAIRAVDYDLAGHKPVPPSGAFEGIVSSFSYIARLDTKIARGDAVEVKGSRAAFADKPAIITSEVKKSDNVLILRDSTGTPAWSGRRR